MPYEKERERYIYNWKREAKDIDRTDSKSYSHGMTTGGQENWMNIESTLNLTSLGKTFKVNVPFAP